jgi:hypothetical protein
MWIKARTIGEDFRRSQKRPNAAVRPKRQAVALQTETATMASSENDPTGITLVFAWEHRLGNKDPNITRITSRPRCPIRAMDRSSDFQCRLERLKQSSIAEWLKQALHRTLSE